MTMEMSGCNRRRCYVVAALLLTQSVRSYVVMPRQSLLTLGRAQRPLQPSNQCWRSSTTSTGSGPVMSLSSYGSLSTARQLYKDEDDHDADFLVFSTHDNEKSAENTTSPPVLPGLEKAWRYAKKPLLSIGSKGATLSHGNSLRQLLEAHTVVKVKVNVKKFGTLATAFATLRDLAEQNGAPAGIECLQTRDSEKTILFAWPGTLARIQDGSFPPTTTPPVAATEATLSPSQDGEL